MGYISPEHYKIAESNGIGRKTLYTRVHLYDWDVERAITQPVRKGPSVWEAWKDVSKVNRAAFYVRVSRGMTHEEAALTPPGRKNKGKLTKADYERAAANGIAKGTLEGRVYVFKWDVERAVTQPPKNNGRRGKWNEINSVRSKRKLR